MWHAAASCTRAAPSASLTLFTAVFMLCAQALNVSNANWGADACDPVAGPTREAFYRLVQKAIDDEPAPR